MIITATKEEMIASIEALAVEMRARYATRTASNAQDFDRCQGQAEAFSRVAWMLSIQVEPVVTKSVGRPRKK